jgi:hypothetical protein
MADKKLGKFDPKVVYMGSDQGPFICGRCEYFEKPAACTKVSGHIDRLGCCNLFEANEAADLTSS